jgi:crotonobetainyl-CoA:carnitine CoA-transferase CaiB-like acyl-CoA transferase
MTTENIFSRVKVVDLASFIAGPSAAVILSDFGADVIKVEPPSGRSRETCAQAPAAAARLAAPLLPVGHRNHSNGGQD